MGKISCRGHENRINLCKLYDIRVELRMKMLSGIVKSDAGAIISDELYIFSAGFPLLYLLYQNYCKTLLPV